MILSFWQHPICSLYVWHFVIRESHYSCYSNWCNCHLIHTKGHQCAEEAGAAEEAVKTRLEKALAGGAGGRLRLERPLETPAVSAQKIWCWDHLYPVDGDLIRSGALVTTKSYFIGSVSRVFFCNQWTLGENAFLVWWDSFSCGLLSVSACKKKRVKNYSHTIKFWARKKYPQMSVH